MGMRPNAISPQVLKDTHARRLISVWYPGPEMETTKEALSRGRDSPNVETVDFGAGFLRMNEASLTPPQPLQEDRLVPTLTNRTGKSVRRAAHPAHLGQD